MGARSNTARAHHLLKELPAEPGEIRRRVVAALSLLDISDASGAVGLARTSVPGHLGIPWSHVSGDERASRLVGRVASPDGRPHAFQLLDLRRTPMAQRRRFHAVGELYDREMVDRSPTWQRLYQPFRVSDQSRLVATHAGSIVGYVFLLRFRGAPCFSPSGPRLQALVPAIRRALVLADRSASRPEAPADFVVDPQGKIRFASAEGHGWTEVPGFVDELRALVRGADSGHHPRSRGPCLAADASITRVGGQGGVRYLVHVAPPKPIRLVAAALLSPSQLLVAELAAKGSTLAEIAEMTGRSRETVRTHLAAAYRRLNVSSRAELGGIMEAMLDG